MQNLKPSEKLIRAIEDYSSRDWTDRAIFLNERFDEAVSELRGWENMSQERAVLPPLAGLTMSVKACFDRAGWTRTCASKVLENRASAEKSAPIVAALEALGATVIAQSNMTEFAYGALGVNGSFGTPRSPLFEDGARVSGGSSSGAAVGVARGYSDFALCSDTSGSARIPAAFCGVAGFSPSRGRYASEGMGWLSTSFDVPGIIASSAKLIDEIDAALTGRALDALKPVQLQHMRFAVPQELDDIALDDEVRQHFDAALSALEKQGVTIVKLPLDILFESARITSAGGIISAEAFAVHQEDLKTSLDLYDVKVGPRVAAGEQVPAYRYLRAKEALERCRCEFDAQIAPFDGYLMPTVPMLPPLLAPLSDMDLYLKTNIRSFSLTEPANRLDLPSISLPISGKAIGLMVTAKRGCDAQLLRAAPLLAACL